jgi:hypothetical protein
MKRCAGNFDNVLPEPCLWFGPESECEIWSGTPLCPVCGSDVVEMEDGTNAKDN